MASQLVARNGLAAAGGLGAGVSAIGAGVGAGADVAGAGAGTTDGLLGAKVSHAASKASAVPKAIAGQWRFNAIMVRDRFMARIEGPGKAGGSPCRACKGRREAVPADSCREKREVAEAPLADESCPDPCVRRAKFSGLFPSCNHAFGTLWRQRALSCWERRKDGWSCRHLSYKANPGVMSCAINK